MFYIIRLHDNPAILNNNLNSNQVLPIFVLDPDLKPQIENIGKRRYQFFLEALTDLDNSLRALNSQLFIIRGKSNVVIPTLMTALGATLLTYDIDIEPSAVSRDQAVNTALQQLQSEQKIEVRAHNLQTLHNMEHLSALCQDRAPTAYSSFLKIFLVSISSLLGTEFFVY